MSDDRDYRRGYAHAIQEVCRVFPELLSYLEEVMEWRKDLSTYQPPKINKIKTTKTILEFK